MRIKERKLIVALTIWGLTLLLLAVTAMTTAARTASASISKNKLQSLFYQANEFYEKGRFQEAVDSYQKLLASGYESGNLYYNLGNAYFKLGNKGRAILYYEKARRLIPGDADLKANLAYAQSGSGAGSETAAAGDAATGDWKAELANYLAYLAPLNQLFVFSSVGFFLLFGVFIYLILAPSRVRTDENKLKGFWLGVIWAIGCLFVISIALTTLTFIEHNQRQAVALEANVTAYFEPKTDATLYYRLAEGNKVRIIEEKGGWWLVKRADGKRGWVEKKNLAEI
ncbi:MAG: tetratricopeptide repeat protein [Firmicutes bacterium]|nr:tetratricopeptide repeat protein [Bacillota bacterium]